MAYSNWCFVTERAITVANYRILRIHEFPTTVLRSYSIAINYCQSHQNYCLVVGMFGIDFVIAGPQTVVVGFRTVAIGSFVVVGCSPFTAAN